MKTRKTAIPNDSLIRKYLPGNYSDAFSCEAISSKEITSQEILNSFWNNPPGWVKGLFKLRNTLVKPFGLHTGDDTQKKEIATICDESSEEIVMLLEDKHLNAWLAVHIEKRENNRLNVTLSTVVKFHYWLGYVYFYAIAPFHNLVVRGALRYSLKHLIQ